MGRLYFLCPIQAAYMAKEFGIRFIVGDQGHYGYKEMRPYTIAHLEQHTTNGKIYVAPESEALFEPKEGDKGRDPRGVFAEFSKLAHDCKAWMPLEQISDDWIWENEDIEIIMREGKHFFSALREGNERY